MFDQSDRPSGAFPEKSSQPVVLILCADLMFAVRLQNIARKAGYGFLTLRPGSIIPEGDALVVDMAERSNWEDTIRQASGRGTYVIAFGPHMDTEARRVARSAGAKRVLANSNLERDLPTILRTLRDAHSGTLLEENIDAG